MATADIAEAVDEIVDNTKPPFLRRVRIRGYKSIAFCDVTLEPLTVLVGRNAAGKSNFLEALSFLRDAVDFSVTEAIKRHGGWSSVTCHTVDTPWVQIEIECRFSAFAKSDGLNSDNVTKSDGENGESFPSPIGQSHVAKYQLIMSGGENTAPVVRFESLSLIDEAGKTSNVFKVHRGTGRASEEMSYVVSGVLKPLPELTRSDRCGLGAIGVPPYREFADGIRAMGFHNVHPGEVRTQRTASNGSLLEKDASNLASVIRCLKDVDPVSLDRVKQYVCHIVEEVSDFWVQEYGEYETIRFRMRSQGASKPAEFDARSMSDGTLRVLANIMAAFQNVPPYGRPSVVGIEEPETALHPRAMNALVDALDEATLRTQVLLTTHSVELLDNPTIQPRNVRVVEMVDGQTIIAPVDAASVEIVRQKLDTLGGLERQNQLEADFDDRERQQQLCKNGQEPPQ